MLLVWPFVTFSPFNTAGCLPALPMAGNRQPVTPGPVPVSISVADIRPAYNVLRECPVTAASGPYSGGKFMPLF